MKAQVKTTLRALFCACFAAALGSCNGGGTVPQGTAAQGTISQPLTTHSPKYRLVILPNGLVPTALNNAGVVVGYDFNTAQPFEYVAGRITELPLLSGDTVGAASDINNRGQIVGYSLNPQAVADSYPICATADCPREHAVLYLHGQAQDLGAVAQPDGLPSIISTADRINDAGEIVGESGFYAGLFTTLPMAIFAPGPVRPIISASGNTVRGSVTGINNVGEIVGQSGSGSDFAFPPGQAFSYPNPIVCSPPLPVSGAGINGINNAGDSVWLLGDGTFAYCQHGVSHPLPLSATRINERGDIIGTALSSQTAVYSRGKLHEAAQLRDDPNILGKSETGAYYISKSRAITGFILSISAGDAALYSHGTLYDLNNLVVKNSSGIVLKEPVAINDSGEIAGQTFSPDGAVIGFLLLPL